MSAAGFPPRRVVLPQVPQVPHTPAASPLPESLGALAAAARMGDRAAFERLYQRLSPLVHAILLHRAPRDERDDLHQEVFVSAWRGLSDLRDTDGVGAWVATIARRAAARHLDRARPRPETLPEELTRPASQRPDEGHLILAELAQLPEAYRETLTLRLVQGLSGPEIAEITGLGADSVRVNLSRGMARLRERLQRKGWP